MVKFKLKGYIRQELDEVVVEARDREEAEEKYNEMFVKGDIESEGFEIEFYDDLLLQQESEFLKLPSLDNCKICGLKEEDMPNEVWDDVDYSYFYLDHGYFIENGGEYGTENVGNYLFKRKLDREQQRLLAYIG